MGSTSEMLAGLALVAPMGGRQAALPDGTPHDGGDDPSKGTVDMRVVQERRRRGHAHEVTADLLMERLGDLLRWGGPLRLAGGLCALAWLTFLLSSCTTTAGT